MTISLEDCLIYLRQNKLGLNLNEPFYFLSSENNNEINQNEIDEFYESLLQYYSGNLPESVENLNEFLAFNFLERLITRLDNDAIVNYILNNNVTFLFLNSELKDKKIYLNIEIVLRLMRRDSEYLFFLNPENINDEDKIRLLNTDIKSAFHIKDYNFNIVKKSKIPKEINLHDLISHLDFKSIELKDHKFYIDNFIEYYKHLCMLFKNIDFYISDDNKFNHYYYDGKIIDNKEFIKIISNRISETYSKFFKIKKSARFIF